MANVTRSGRKLKDEDINSSKMRHTSGKGSSTSGSMTTDTSGLRRSARETPSKKQTASSPSITRKSERIEKRTPPTPPVKRQPDLATSRRTPSPSKISDKSDNHQSSSSSGSKKSEKRSSPLTTKRKRESIEKNGKQPMVNFVEPSKNEEMNRSPNFIIFKKNRMDARSYKAILLKKKKARKSDPSGKPKGHDVLFQGDAANREASGSKEVVDVAESSGRNGEELRQEESQEGCEGSGDTSSSSSEESIMGRSRNHVDIELYHSSRKAMDQPEEGLECNDEVCSPVSKCSDNSLQLSPGTLAKEVAGDAARTLLGCSTAEALQKVDLMESTSEGRLISGNHYTRKAFSGGPSKRNRKVEDLDSDASATVVPKEISADGVCSPQLEDKRNSLEQCVACSKRRKLDGDSQKNICSCNGGKSLNSCNAATEEVHKQAALLPSSQKGGSSVQCKDMDETIVDSDHIVKKRVDVAQLGNSDLSPVAQRNIRHDGAELSITVEISNRLHGDGNELRSRDSAGSTNECTKTDLKETPFKTQTESDPSTCVICKRGENLICCDGNGCKRSFHIYCLDPPLKVVPLGSWHCFWCVKKKMELGVHSVSAGIESIWDVREQEVPDSKGMQKQKQYFVKYRGLAHVHNCWISEKQLLSEASMLLAKFKKNQVLRWNSEWVTPQRLLQKRMLMSLKQRDTYFKEDDGDISNCQYEWFVKWNGLGYEHATWELENSQIFKSAEARTLVEKYESRRQKAKKVYDLSRADKERKDSFSRLSKLPCDGLSGLDNSHLSFINKLREYWHKCQNAVVEDQERILKVILFILSIESDVSRPFLVISTSSSIAAWEAEFIRVAQSVSVVTYCGTRDVRECIRAMEFYEDGGCLMFQVLLSTPDVIIEDLESLECIGWEAVIVDECQRFSVSRYLDKIRTLTTDFRLLLFSGQIKDCIAEYLKLLTFVGSDENGDANLKFYSNDTTLIKLKERFARFNACERKPDSKFLEYWVPVRLSNVQLEQYCGTLLSNFITLRSCSKNDTVGALRDILISCRKSCDHPYLVDQSLQVLLGKDRPEAEYLDIGVNASGKLQVLDKILQEIKKRDQRALVLFQSISGTGRICIGDILDDFLRQRFGPDSYERVESGLVPAKRQAALSMFNNKERGRFVFLLENRACFSSIKLSSVDVVILFDSDWNPLNDLRALQKISIDSHCEQLKVFRLYSAFTVEEKVLMLAKKDTSLESNIQNMNRSASHTLLMWGASYLFKMLEEFHGGSTISFEFGISAERRKFLNDLAEEFSTHLEVENNNTTNGSFIVMAQQSGATYSKDIPLLGELEMKSGDEESSQVFWTNLLEGRHPRWIYSSGPSQRVRKKVQYLEESPKRPQVIENDEVVKKRKKIVSNANDPKTLNSLIDDKGKVTGIGKEGGTPVGNGFQSLPRLVVNTNTVNRTVAKDINDQSDASIVDSDERANLRYSQKSLHLSLKSEIPKLCEILQLPEGIKSMTGKLLEYIMNNHQVPREPVTILQAFQISLCWSAASLLKHKINRKESLALARQHFNFECKEEETESIYKRLRMLKKNFRREAVDSMPSPAASSKEAEKHILHGRTSSSKASGQQELEEGEIRESSQSPNFFNQEGSVKGHSPDAEKTDESSKTEPSNGVKQVKKIYSKRMSEISKKQMDELEAFNKHKDKAKAELEKKHRLESLLIRSLHTQMSVRLDKLKVVDQELGRKLEEFDIEYKKLLDMQQAERDNEKRIKVHWLEEAKCRRLVDPYSMLPLPNSGLLMEHMLEVGHMKAPTLSGSPDIHSPNKATPVVPGDTGHDREVEILVTAPQAVVSDTVLGLSPDIQDANEVAPVVPHDTVNDKEEVIVSTEQAVDSSAVLDKEVEVNSCNEPQSVAMHSGDMNDENNAMVPEPEIVTGSEQHARLGTSDTGDSLPLEQSQIDSPFAQQQVAPAQDSHISSLQIPVVQLPQPALSATVLGEDAAGHEVQSSTLGEHLAPQSDDAITFNHSNDNMSVQLVDLQPQLPPSTDPQRDLPACTLMNHEQSDGAHTSLQPSEVQTQPPAEVSNHTVPCNMRLQHQNQSRCNSPQMTEETHMSTEGQTEALAHCVSRSDSQLQPTQPAGTVVRGSGTHFSNPRGVAVIAESSQRPPLARMTSRVSQQFLVDPLQNELARISKESEQAIKIHEDVTMRLNSQCEREMEEIRRKYKALLQDAELSFAQRRKEHEASFHKIHMNRVLAEAFRLKFTDTRTGSPGPLQGGSSGFMQQSFQVSSQQNTPRSTVLPVPTSAPPAAPPVQVVHNPSALFSNPVRPHFSPVISPSGNHQVGSEIRAPAPHLQPFRPTTSVSAASSSPHMITQQSPCSLSTSTTLASQLTPRAPTYTSVPFSRSYQKESTYGFPIPNTSNSAPEVLSDNHTGANPPNLFPPLRDLGHSLDTWGMSELAMPSTTPAAASRTGTPSDIVCLSDDD